MSYKKVNLKIGLVNCLTVMLDYQYIFGSAVLSLYTNNALELEKILIKIRQILASFPPFCPNKTLLLKTIILASEAQGNQRMVDSAKTKNGSKNVTCSMSHFCMSHAVCNLQQTLSRYCRSSFISVFSYKIFTFQNGIETTKRQVLNK